MSDAANRPTNRLAAETSPYLLQHAHNPVDWYPWGEAALARARETDRPIFLSIGYAACHWCHVMERESFEEEATAALLNDGFVAVKVDREERPDLDAIYMDAVQAMTGGGGWPLSVFLTPDGEPFYGGTYFPDQPRHGLPSFRDVLAGVAQAWHERRAEVEQSAGRLAEAVARQVAAPAAEGAVTAALLDGAVAALADEFDARNGGWGGAPKFPQAMAIEFLLREQLRTTDDRPLAMARRSLDAMAAGGIYDQLGGGFARYSTDAHWLVPHFEKMLYDNAQLARAYLHAWQLTGAAEDLEVASATIDFMRRELAAPDGGFISSLDADTASVEGATYVWSKTEIDVLIGADAERFDATYGVTGAGNWEGHNILHVAGARALLPELAGARARLLAARAKRPQPARDEKVLTAWNGLAIAALAEGARATGRADWLADAARAADQQLAWLAAGGGRLSRSHRAGRARGQGVLEDYADLAEGLLALYETDFDERRFVAARDLADTILGHFADPGGGFFDTADDHEALIARPRNAQDNATPSGGAMAATVLLRLAALTGEERYRAPAAAALAQVAGVAGRYPTAFGQWLSAAQLALAAPIELAIIGQPMAADTQALLAVARQSWRPHMVLALAADGATSVVPLLAGRTQRDQRATAYLCHGWACLAPVTTQAELAAQLAG